MMTIELSDDEYDVLMLALAAATANAMMHKDRALANNFIRLANAVNRNNPNWVPSWRQSND